MPVLKIKKIARLTGHNAAIFALTPGDTPPYFLSGAGDGWVVRWNPEAPEIGSLVAKVEAQIFSLLNLPDLKKVVVGNMKGGLHWVDLEEPALTKNIAHHTKGVFDIFRVQDAVFTIGGDGKITRWSAEQAKVEESFYLSNQSLRCATFHPQRNEIALGASDHSIYILDADSLVLKHTIPHAHTHSVFAVKYSPDGRYILSGGRDAQLKIRDTSQGFQEVFTQPAHWFTINHIAFHPSGNWFATASRDKTIKIWDAASFELLKVLEVVRDGCHTHSVNRLLWLPHENYLISASDDRTMIVWKID